MGARRGTSDEGTVRTLRLFAARALRAAAPRIRTSVEIALMPNSGLRALKRALLGKDVPVVDVLAFPHPEGFPAPGAFGRFLGEIYVNGQIARTDPPRAKFLVLHGVLHLLGYRHDGKRDTMRMERLEERLCRELLRRPRHSFFHGITLHSGT